MVKELQLDECWYKEHCNDRCDKLCLRFMEMKYLVENSNLPRSKWFPMKLIANYDYDAFVRLSDIKTNIKDFVEQGKNLYLYSDKFGNGKTSWSIKLLLAYFNKIWYGNGFRVRGIFVSVPEYIDRNRDWMNKSDDEFSELKKQILECDVVVWDDISSTRLTDFNHSILLNAIDARILANKCNIFTGNADLGQLRECLGGRLASRIWNGSEIITFVDDDKRGLSLDGRIANTFQSTKD